MRNVLNKPKQKGIVENLLILYTNIYTKRNMENSGIKVTYGKLTVLISREVKITQKKE